MTCDLLIGWRNKEPAWDLIGQDNHWEVPKRLRINTQNTLLETLLTSPRALECSVLLDLSLSLQLWTTPSQLLPWWEEKPPSHLNILLFFDFSLFSFRWVRVLSCVCQRRQAQDSAKPANAHFNDSWTLSQSATSEKPFSAKDNKRESFKHKSNASKTPRSLLCWCHFNIYILASLKSQCEC